MDFLVMVGEERYLHLVVHWWKLAAMSSIEIEVRGAGLESGPRRPVCSRGIMRSMDLPLAQTRGSSASELDSMHTNWIPSCIASHRTRITSQPPRTPSTGLQSGIRSGTRDAGGSNDVDASNLRRPLRKVELVCIASISLSLSQRAKRQADVAVADKRTR